MTPLEKIVKNLKAKEEVDALFFTGSYGVPMKPHSDIDVVIILKENSKKISSLYQWIDGVFADIFFFDHFDLEKIETLPVIEANNMSGIFVAWLEKADVQFDKSGKLTNLLSTLETLKLKVKVPQLEKSSYWQKINYNLVANKRYFKSGDSLYHEALQMRLLYSVSEVISGYFEFREIPWRGEKNAVTFLKENDFNFYKLFVSYTQSVTLEDKFNFYIQMVYRVFTNEYSQWSIDDIVPQTQDTKTLSKESLVEYWQGLIN